MMKRLLTMLLAFCVCITAQADPPEIKTIDYILSTDTDLKTYQANVKTYRWTVQNNAATINGTGYTPVMYWATKNKASAVVTAACTWVTQTNCTFDAQFVPSQLNTNGMFMYGVGVVSGDVSIVRQGSFQIQPDPYATGAPAILYARLIDWSMINSTNGTNGLFLPGSGIVFRAANNVRGQYFIDSLASTESDPIFTNWLGTNAYAKTYAYNTFALSNLFLGDIYLGNAIALNVGGKGKISSDIFGNFTIVAEDDGPILTTSSDIYAFTDPAGDTAIYMTTNSRTLQGVWGIDTPATSGSMPVGYDVATNLIATLSSSPVGIAYTASNNVFTVSNRFEGNIVAQNVDTNTLIVSGFGTVAICGTYTNAGSLAGKPIFYTPTDSIFWDAGNSAWAISDGANTIYYSNENTDYPWQVVTWTASPYGSNPAGTVVKLSADAFSVIEGISYETHSATQGTEIVNYQTATNLIATLSSSPVGIAYTASNNVFTGSNILTSTLAATNDGRSVWGSGLDVANINATSYGAVQRGNNFNSTMTIDENSTGAGQYGFNFGSATLTIGKNVYGAGQRGFNYGGAWSLLDDAYGSQQYGYNYQGTVTGSGKGSLQLFNLTAGQTATMTGNASIGLGACTVSNSQAIVAGDGQESHGDGTVSASGGFWDNGTRLVNGVGDNLGNHTATTAVNMNGNSLTNAASVQANYVTSTVVAANTITGAQYVVNGNVKLNSSWVSGDGQNEGLFVESWGGVVASNSAGKTLIVLGAASTPSYFGTPAIGAAFGGSANPVIDVNSIIGSGYVSDIARLSTVQSPAVGYNYIRSLAGMGTATTTSVFTVRGDGHMAMSGPITNGYNLAIYQSDIAGEEQANIGLFTHGDTGVSYPNIYGIRTRGTTAAPSAVQADDALLAVYGRGWDTNYTGSTAGMYVKAAQNWGNGSNGSYLAFETTTTNTLIASRAERVRITSEGNVGIATTNPATKLDVNGVITARSNLVGVVGSSYITNFILAGTLTTNAPADGQVQKYNAADARWYAANDNSAAGGDPVDARPVTNNINLNGWGVTNGSHSGNGFGLTNLNPAAYSSATFAPYVITPAATVTVLRANGWMQSYRPETNTTILIENNSTNLVAQVNLNIWAGTNSITFGTQNVTFATAPVLNTNGCSTILYYSGLWCTNWAGRQLQ